MGNLTVSGSITSFRDAFDAINTALQQNWTSADASVSANLKSLRQEIRQAVLHQETPTSARYVATYNLGAAVDAITITALGTNVDQMFGESHLSKVTLTSLSWSYPAKGASFSVGSTAGVSYDFTTNALSGAFNSIRLVTPWATLVGTGTLSLADSDTTLPGGSVKGSLGSLAITYTTGHSLTLKGSFDFAQDVTDFSNLGAATEMIVKTPEATATLKGSFTLINDPSGYNSVIGQVAEATYVAGGLTFGYKGSVTVSGNSNGMKALGGTINAVSMQGGGFSLAGSNLYIDANGLFNPNMTLKDHNLDGVVSAQDFVAYLEAHKNDGPGIGGGTILPPDVDYGTVQVLTSKDDPVGQVNTVVASFDYVLPTTVNNLVLSGTAALGVGNATANAIQAANNSTILRGLAGDDTLFGGSASDTLVGGADDDYLVGGEGGDKLASGTGDNVLLGGGGFDVVYLAGRPADYKISITSAYAGGDPYTINGLSAGDVIRLASSDGRVDRLVGVEKVVFLGAGDDPTTDNYAADNTERLVSRDELLRGLLPSATLIGYRAGTTGADTMDGTARVDTLDGLEGDDILRGQAGNDNLSGGAGNDRLDGGPGNDTLGGGSGNDTLLGGTGNDTYYVDAAGDQVIENPGEGTNDRVVTLFQSVSLNDYPEIEWLTFGGDGVFAAIGNKWANRIVGGWSNDTLDGGAGADILLGGAGDDLYRFDTPADKATESANAGIDTIEAGFTSTLGANIENLLLTGAVGVNGIGNLLDNRLTGNAGANLLNGLAGNDTLLGLGGIDLLQGGDGNDSLDGGDGNDKLFAGKGDDTLVAGAGSDIFMGEAGNDTLDLTGLDILFAKKEKEGGFSLNKVDATTVTMTINTQVLTIKGAWDPKNTGDKGIETFKFDDNASVTLAQLLDGVMSFGPDPYEDKEGINDNKRAGLGNDTLLGVVGNDSLYGEGGNDSLDGGVGDDTLVGGAGNDILIGGTGNDSLTGGLGDDIYYVDAAGDSVTEAAAQGTDTVRTTWTDYTLGSDVEKLIFSDTANGAGTANFKGTGNALANTLTGGSGDDTLDGGENDGKADILNGGAGNDTYKVGAGDTAIEKTSTGTDAGGTDIVLVQGSLATFWTLGVYLENLTNQGTAETFTGIGNGHANVLIGGAKVDVLNGWADNDTLDGGAGADRLYGGAGADSLLGGLGDDLLDGGTENDLLAGGEGNDKLIGGWGNDELTGGLGNDTLSGGLGDADMAIFSGTADQYSVSRSGPGYTVSGVDGTDSLDGIELLKFGDGAPTSIVSFLAPPLKPSAALPNHVVPAMIYPAADAARWNAGSALGTPVTLTYSFMQSIPSYSYAGDHPGFQPMTAVQRSAVLSVLDHYSRIANLTFVEVASGDGQLRFGTERQTGSSGYAYTPDLTDPLGGDVWLANNQDANLTFDAGSRGLITLLHETGHALGLKHPGNYGSGDVPPFLTTDDTTRYTVMSYTERADGKVVEITGTQSQYTYTGTDWHPETAMPYDIAAIQHLYGANVSAASHAGNNRHVYATDRPFFATLWDGGGVDVIDCSAFARTCVIDLREGAFSSIGKVLSPYDLLPPWYAGSAVPTYTGQNNLAIAYGCIIENAIGGSADDVLIGNEVANTLAGDDGNDTLTGGEGADVFHFDTAPNATDNVDLLTDFTAGSDRILLDADTFAGLGPVLGGAFHAASGVLTAIEADDRILYDSATGFLYYDADGSGVATTVKFAQLGTGIHPALAAADFMIG